MPSSHRYVAVTVLLAICGGIAACGGEQNPPTTPPPPENEAPAATISGPADGASFASGESIDFQGTGEDPEDGTLDGGSLVWTSDVDDGLGEGSPVTRDDLSEGAHTITLTVTDSEGATGTASIQLTIESNEAPTATISAPADGASFAAGESIDFQGTGEDPEDGTLDGGSLVWTSDVDDVLGEGSPVTRDDLTEGTHTITLTAIDGEGATGTASIELMVESAAQADADGDGFTVEGGDCDDADASIHPDAADPVDDLLIDSNCDGPDGDLSLAVLVATDGTDGSECGTPEAPCLTVGEALTRAAADGAPEVYVAEGSYAESVVLPDDVSLYGGFASDFSTRDPASHESAIVGAPGGIDFQGETGQAITLLLESHAGRSEVADLRIVGRDATGLRTGGQGSNAYAVVVWGSQSGAETVITRNVIEAGNGAPGSHGSPGENVPTRAADGDPGQNGREFSTTCNDSGFGAGGAGAFASGSRGGGDGGDGGTMDTDCSTFIDDLDAQPGSAGDAGGFEGFGGNGGEVCVAGHPGGAGADGLPGSNGAGGGGADVGTGIWTGSSGTAGSLGDHGHGGGGGGGAGGCDTGTDSYGAGGGGGGAGGQRASIQGTGGAGGGGSFAVYIVDASPTVTMNEVSGGTGGRGGDGGDGGRGEAGGLGGNGGDPGTTDAGPGGDGGDGGRGGASGAGGGGAGGASIGIAILGNSSPQTADNVFTLGNAGAGGGGGFRPDPSSTAGSGASGAVATIHTF